MTDRETLIEEAAKAIANVRWNHALPHASRGGANWTDRDLARAALAVFEKAHTPNDDEREALAKKATTPDGRLEYHLLEGEAVTMYPYWAADLRTVIAGFRRFEPQGEPSEAQVADSLALARFDTDELHQIRLRRGSDAELLDALNAYHLDEHELWGDAEPPTLDNYSTRDADRMRAALRAANNIR